MCGSYRRWSDKKKLADIFHSAIVDSLTTGFAPDYDVRPTTLQPIIKTRGETGDRELLAARWGLIPSWQRPEESFSSSSFNVRSEAIEESSLLREALANRRCLVPADSFFEWRKIRKNDNPKYNIGMSDGSTFAFAGLWSAWYHPSTTEWIQSFAIITTQANELLMPIHTRMPVIVSDRDYKRWLFQDKKGKLPLDLLRPYEAKAMRAELTENADISPLFKGGSYLLETNSQ